MGTRPEFAILSRSAFRTIRSVGIEWNGRYMWHVSSFQPYFFGKNLSLHLLHRQVLLLLLRRTEKTKQAW